MERRFRLSAVQRMRTADLDKAARGLGEARRVLAAAEAAVEDLRMRIDTCVPAMTSTPTEVKATAMRRDLLREQLARDVRALSTKRDEVATALDGWRTARADLRAVEALHERHRLLVAADDARKAQRESDDLAGSRTAFAAAGTAAGDQNAADWGGDAA
jgi:flagellar export protein FliJ